MKKIFTNPRFLLGVYILLALGATLQSYFGNPTTFNNLQYTAYNNYIIFKQSFFHLIENKDLYILYPSEHWDLYKYSPTFSLLMAPLAILPDVIGLLCWNLLNALVLFFAIKNIPLKDSKLFGNSLMNIEQGTRNKEFRSLSNNDESTVFDKLRNSLFLVPCSIFKKNNSFSIGVMGLCLVFIALEMLTSLQNEQSNALMAGLIILAFVLLEKDKIWLGTLCIALTVFIKIFGVVAFALFLVYPKKGKFILASTVWVIVLTVLPLLVISMDQFQLLYESWWRMLGEDHAASYGYSVMGWLQSWFGLDVSKNVIVLLGVVLFCLPLIKIKKYTNYKFRWRLLASILIWVVIFNHKAESPTFVIAMSGVGIWYFLSKIEMEKVDAIHKVTSSHLVNTVLVVLAFVFTSLSPTDLFPRFLRENIVIPYVLKAVPCILIWGKIIWEMYVLRSSSFEAGRGS